MLKLVTNEQKKVKMKFLIETAFRVSDSQDLIFSPYEIDVFVF